MNLDRGDCWGLTTQKEVHSQSCWVNVDTVTVLRLERLSSKTKSYSVGSSVDTAEEVLAHQVLTHHTVEEVLAQVLTRVRA